MNKIKTFHGVLISKIHQAEKNKNYEILQILKTLLDEYNYYQKIERVEIERWKGKSKIEVREVGDKVIAEKWQKSNPESKPHLEKFEYTREDIRNILSAIRLAEKYVGEDITSKDVARYFYGIRGINETVKHKPLFKNGNFIWENFFNSRMEHYRYTILLSILRQWGIIEYKHLGKIKRLK